MPQYGHLPIAVVATSMKTRGWLLQSGIFGFGAEHHARALQLGREQLDHRARSRISGCHRYHTLVSHSAYLGLRPLTMSKNALWIFSVIGPRVPLPSSIRSSSRIGVTSAAVPVKNASSQM